MLDRERTLRQFDALVAEARAREQAAIVRVVGPAGSGKSALLRHLAQREELRGASVMYVAASADEELQPGALAQRIASAPETRTEAHLAKAIGDVLKAVTLLCIDDMQWADELSARMLRRALRRAPRSTVLLGDRREDYPEGAADGLIRLAPLRRIAASSMVRRIYPQAAEAVVAEIIDAAAGNAFTIEALARAAALGGARAREDVEPSLEAALASRLRRSSANCRTVLRYAAIAYSPTISLVARASRIPVETVAAELAGCRDIVDIDGERIAFRHALLAEAVTRSIDDPAAYHCTVLHACDANDDRPGALAAALHAALGCNDRHSAAALSLRLARRLAAEGALRSAAAHARSALDFAPHPPPPEYAVEYAGIAQARARDHEAASFLRVELGRAIDRGDATTAAALIGSFAASAIALERPEELEAFAARIAAIPDVDEAAMAKVRSARYVLAAFAGPLEAVLTLDPRTASWPDHRPFAFAAALAGDSERSRSALQWYSTGLAPRHARVTVADYALEAAIGLFERGPGALEESGADRVAPFNARSGYATIAALRLVRSTATGNWSEADAVVAAIADDDESDEPYAALDARLMYHAVAGKPLVVPERTVRTVRALIAQGRKRHAIAAAAWLWLIMQRARDPVPVDLRHFVLSELQTTPMPYLLGGVPLAVARLAPHAGREASLLAVQAWCPYESRWHAAHRQLATATITGDHAGLRAARDAFDSLGAPVFAAVAGALLPIPRASDAALAVRLGLGEADETGPTTALSARERDVAELAAQGHGNRDIAAALGISERTVEVHVTSILRKLRVRSRAGIAARLS